MRGSSGFRLLIDIRCKLVKTVVVANYEVAAEIVAAKTGEGIQRQVEQVFSFPIYLVIKDNSGSGGPAHKRKDHEKSTSHQRVSPEVIVCVGNGNLFAVR